MKKSGLVPSGNLICLNLKNRGESGNFVLESLIKFGKIVDVPDRCKSCSINLVVVILGGHSDSGFFVSIENIN